MVMDLILTISTFVIGFALAWLCVSGSRFRQYELYEGIEEPLRHLCATINLLKDIISLGEKGDMEFVFEAVPGFVVARGGKRVHDFFRVIYEKRRESTPWSDDDLRILDEAQKHLDRMLGACRDEKRKLEGLFIGNLRTLCLLAKNRPTGHSAILRKITARADDSSDKLTWTGVVK